MFDNKTDEAITDSLKFYNDLKDILKPEEMPAAMLFISSYYMDTVLGNLIANNDSTAYGILKLGVALFGDQFRTVFNKIDALIKQKQNLPL